ncbi:MAG: hypothetical protein U0935_24420 [Pirellulales bacterium]
MARRWANWAANLLVSGTIAVAGIVLGREVLRWWYVEAPTRWSERHSTGVPGTPDADPLGQVGTGESLQFGDLPFAWRHGVVAGEVAEALRLLRRECSEAAGTATVAREVGPAERRLLAGLANRAPDLENGRWSVYSLERPVPLVVAVTGTGTTPTHQRRVLAWGILLPEAPDATVAPDAPADSEATGHTGVRHWTWFTWRPGGAETTAGKAEVWPVPPGGVRTLAIRTEEGGYRLAYGGTGVPDDWRRAFDTGFSKLGWEPVESGEAGWARVGRGWQRTYRQLSPGNAAEKAAKRGEAERPAVVERHAEVLVLQQESAALQAVLIVSPRMSAQ